VLAAVGGVGRGVSEVLAMWKIGYSEANARAYLTMAWRL